MAAGIYKNGVAIIVTYQAVNLATGKTITMSVYDEAHALDEAKSGVMAEIASTGRYWKTFTPDAEGEWIVTIVNTTDGGGNVIKSYAVAGHDMDSVGDAVAAIKAVTDVESGVKADVATVDGKADTIATAVAAIQAVTDVETGVKAAVEALHDFDPAEDTVATVTILTGHTPQTGDTFALADGENGFVAIKAAMDGIGSPAMVG